MVKSTQRKLLLVYKCLLQWVWVDNKIAMLWPLRRFRTRYIYYLYIYHSPSYWFWPRFSGQYIEADCQWWSIVIFCQLFEKQIKSIISYPYNCHMPIVSPAKSLSCMPCDGQLLSTHPPSPLILSYLTYKINLLRLSFTGNLCCLRYHLLAEYLSDWVCSVINVFK